MKPKLRLPLRSLIEDGFGEADLQRAWRGIQGRATESGRRRPRVLMATGATGLVIACLVGLLLVRKPNGGPLRLPSGDLPALLAVDDRAPTRTLELADGSFVVGHAGTRLEVLDNQAGVFLTALRRGHTRFQVQPGGPRRWIVECGPLAVEVVGTEFEVDRTPDHVEVSVLRGVVVVRGDVVPDRVQKLAAGEHLRVMTEQQLETAGSAAPPPSTGAAASEPDPAKEGADRSGVGAVDSGAGSAAPFAGADVDELVRRSDLARRAGDLVLAERLLGEAVDRGRGKPAAAVAALTLARLIMTTDPARAARTLSRALAAGMPQGLEEDARARLVEARALSGDREGARKAAHAYEQRFPSGAHIEQIRRWTAQ